MRALLRGFLFLVAAVACAALSNAIAGPERRLLWSGSIEASPPRPPAASGSEAPSPSAASKATDPPEAFPPHADSPWVEISGDEAMALHSRGNVPFLDARRSSLYREGHIARARSFPVWEADVDDRVKAFYAEGHDPNAPIVAYCSGGDCEDSHMLAQKLFLAGFNGVFVYKDGFPDWQKRGLSVTRGGEP